MTRILIFSLLILSLSSCKKTEYSPVGPTDVRVKNISGHPFTEIIVNTSGGTDTLGEANIGAFTEYFRFEKAFPKAEISARIEGELYSTGAVDYNGMTYIGKAKISYEVIVSDAATKKLGITNCSLDAPLD
jgi:hypothetical protein